MAIIETARDVIGDSIAEAREVEKREGQAGLFYKRGFPMKPQSY